MKILHVIRSVHPQGGGPLEGIRQLVPALAARGIATEVMSLDAPDAPWTTDFPVPLHATGPSHLNYGYTPRAVPWLRENGGKYDAVIVNGIWQYGSLAVWHALRKTSTPYYVYPHGMLDPWFQHHYPLKHLKKCLYWPWAEYRVLRDAKAVLFTSEEEKLDARKSFQPYRCHEVVTGYGIAAPPGDRSRQRELFLKRHPEIERKKTILFLGRMHEKKGCDLLLRAWKEVVLSLGNGHGAETHLIMAGPIDNTYASEMRELARQLGLEQQVTWTGMLTGDLKWGSLAAADVFILPSHQENFGISVVEALACGVPVLISNKVNIWREIAKDDVGLVEKDDLAGTIRLLERWFSLDFEYREKMRARAESCFARRFDITKTAEALTALLGPLTV